MNRNRRKDLVEALGKLRKAREITSNVADDEREALDSIPENLQSSDRFSEMEDALDLICEAIDSMDEAEESITQAIGG